MQTLGEAGEEALVQALQRLLAPERPFEVPNGDDAAVWSLPSPRAVATADAMVEHVHFERAWAPPEALGHKLVAVNVSDLAAMGARPSAALLTLCLPADTPWDWALGLAEGLARAARRWGLDIAGGDVTGSPGPAVLNLAAIGTPWADAVLRRDGAEPGDGIYVTGPLGGADLGLRLLQGRATGDAPGAVRRFLWPEPRLDAGRRLAEWGRCHAAMDLSDGLARDAARMARASGVRLVLDLDALPLHPDLRSRPRAEALAGACHGGEDYELLLAAPCPPPVPCTCIGRVESGPAGLAWTASGQPATPPPGGSFDHFEP